MKEHEGPTLRSFFRDLFPQVTQTAYSLSTKEALLPFNDRDSSRPGLQQEEGDVWQGGQDSAYGAAEVHP